MQGSTAEGVIDMADIANQGSVTVDCKILLVCCVFAVP
jgi:hypothetical protein